MFFEHRLETPGIAKIRRVAIEPGAVGIGDLQKMSMVGVVGKQEFLAAGIGAGDSQSREHRFRARVGKANLLHSR